MAGSEAGEQIHKGAMQRRPTNGAYVTSYDPSPVLPTQEVVHVRFCLSA